MSVYTIAFVTFLVAAGLLLLGVAEELTRVVAGIAALVTAALLVFDRPAAR